MNVTGLKMVSQAQAVTEISQPTVETREPERFSHDSKSVAVYVFHCLDSVLMRDL